MLQKDDKDDAKEARKMMNRVTQIQRAAFAACAWEEGVGVACANA